MFKLIELSFNRNSEQDYLSSDSNLSMFFAVAYTLFVWK